VVIDVGDGVLELVNPQLLEASCDVEEAAEGCLSSPGEYGLVKRPHRVRVRAQNRKGKWKEYEGEGLLARAFCHEIDHLDGRLFKDLASRMLTPEELGDEE
jgi:peptide deformylase